MAFQVNDVSSQLFRDRKLAGNLAWKARIPKRLERLWRCLGGITSACRRGWCTASREKLITELERPERENGQLRRERDPYRQERDCPRKKIERLEDELDDARRALHRQAAPFSRGTPRRRPRRPGRKPGAAYGWRIGPSRRPSMNATPHGCRLAAPIGGRLTTTRHTTQYQEDLPDVRPVVRAFDIAIGHSADCGRRVQGRHPLQTSEAIGAAQLSSHP